VFERYKVASRKIGKGSEEGRKDNTSWLDFHISYRGISESLEEMRTKNYQLGGDSLLWRPWKITTEVTKDSFNQLKNAIKILRDNKKTKWPRSKLNELARSLIQGKESTNEYLKQASARRLYLPDITNPTVDDQGVDMAGWHLKTQKDKKTINATPYFDILEIMDFYPECLLD